MKKPRLSPVVEDILGLIALCVIAYLGALILYAAQ